MIYRQTRIGRRKREFTMYKFRSMSTENNADMTTWGTRNDGRRTGFGAFLRKYKPGRAAAALECAKRGYEPSRTEARTPVFCRKVPGGDPPVYDEAPVRPGITGWAQVNGWRGDTSIEERIKCDIYYIENWTFLLDIKILFLTIFKGIVNKSEDL